ncbi:hypothetical protein MAL08_12635 [Leptospira noguchii]|uniref:hypothetical protein n=1 Tax=Leptospira noguchii TaxID=28182 RepID=UPI001FB57369|nr:hypothetical protein [Leptospira noguchii]UOG39537.1 hypothetical protein MAL08_12635 [Leptospira noguchii]
MGAKSAVASHFNYEICELRRRPVGSRCIEFIIRPNFLTSNSRYLKICNVAESVETTINRDFTVKF